jgi:hypothetical protein
MEDAENTEELYPSFLYSASPMLFVVNLLLEISDEILIFDYNKFIVSIREL